MEESIKSIFATKHKNAFDLVRRYDLTDRELQVLELLAQHYSNPEIAGRMEISRNTVKFHLKNLFGKLGVMTRQEAARKVLQAAASD